MFQLKGSIEGLVNEVDRDQSRYVEVFPVRIVVIVLVPRTGDDAVIAVCSVANYFKRRAVRFCDIINLLAVQAVSIGSRIESEEMWGANRVDVILGVATRSPIVGQRLSDSCRIQLRRSWIRRVRVVEWGDRG